MQASVCGNVLCSFQPKSTSSVVIGKTPNNVEEQENTAAKNEDTEEEWVEQKTDLKKLPRQYMQLSKIRLTGMFKVPQNSFKVCINWVLIALGRT